MIADFLRQATDSLAAGPHPDRAKTDAELLLSRLLGRNRAWMLANRTSVPDPEIYAPLNVLLKRRLAGEPIQYILGETEFFGLPFRVTPAVLIPRPETEHLVEKALELAALLTNARILDVGTGSGAIAVALAHRLPGAPVTSIDLSHDALAVAGENAKSNGVAVRFLLGDLLAPVAGETFDLVVSNPPYVPLADRETLSVEVRDHEPALALFAGGDGLDIYRRLIPAAHAVLVPGGWLLLEIGYAQQPAIEALLRASLFEAIEFLPDLQGIPRVACARRPLQS